MYVIDVHCMIMADILFHFSHIMEHLEGVIEKPESDMTPQELQLHYFKMHDYDGNNLLDGLELATAITHVHKEVCCFRCFWLYAQIDTFGHTHFFY